jgi:hypothetical protein
LILGRQLSTRAIAPECAMSNILLTVRTYYAFYCSYFSSQWNHLTPAKYGVLLLGVGAFGWLLMKAGNKRT